MKRRAPHYRLEILNPKNKIKNLTYEKENNFLKINNNIILNSDLHDIKLQSSYFYKLDFFEKID